MSTDVSTAVAACFNCGAELEGTFCSRCGQSNRRARLTVRGWFEDLVTHLTDLDSSRIWQTVIGLTLRPGRVPLDYVEGRRIRYVSPIRYAIGTCALWWAAVALQPAASTVWWVQYGQFINLASLPLLVPFVQLAFLRTLVFNYAEYLGFMLFTTGHVFLWRVGLALIALVPDLPGHILNYADSLLFVIYFGWALWGFHRGRVRYLWLRVVAGILAMGVGGTIINLPVQLLRLAK